MWICDLCTLHNRDSNRRCEACGVRRTVVSVSSHRCDNRKKLPTCNKTIAVQVASFPSIPVNSAANEESETDKYETITVSSYNHTPKAASRKRERSLTPETSIRVNSVFPNKVFKETEGNNLGADVLGNLSNNDISVVLTPIRQARQNSTCCSSNNEPKTLHALTEQSKPVYSHDSAETHLLQFSKGEVQEDNNSNFLLSSMMPPISVIDAIKENDTHRPVADWLRNRRKRKRVLKQRPLNSPQNEVLVRIQLCHSSYNSDDVNNAPSRCNFAPLVAIIPCSNTFACQYKCIRVRLHMNNFDVDQSCGPLVALIDCSGETGALNTGRKVVEHLISDEFETVSPYIVKRNVVATEVSPTAKLHMSRIFGTQEIGNKLDLLKENSFQDRSIQIISKRTDQDNDPPYLTNDTKMTQQINPPNHFKVGLDDKQLCSCSAKDNSCIDESSASLYTIMERNYKSTYDISSAMTPGNENIAILELAHTEEQNSVHETNDRFAHSNTLDAEIKRPEKSAYRRMSSNCSALFYAGFSQDDYEQYQEDSLHASVELHRMPDHIESKETVTSSTIQDTNSKSKEMSEFHKPSAICDSAKALVMDNPSEDVEVTPTLTSERRGRPLIPDPSLVVTSLGHANDEPEREKSQIHGVSVIKNSSNFDTTMSENSALNSSSSATHGMEPPVFRSARTGKTIEVSDKSLAHIARIFGEASDNQVKNSIEHMASSTIGSLQIRSRNLTDYKSTSYSIPVSFPQSIDQTRSASDLNMAWDCSQKKIGITRDIIVPDTSLKSTDVPCQSNSGDVSRFSASFSPKQSMQIGFCSAGSGCLLKVSESSMLTANRILAGDDKDVGVNSNNERSFWTTPSHPVRQARRVSVSGDLPVYMKKDEISEVENHVDDMIPTTFPSIVMEPSVHFKTAGVGRELKVSEKSLMFASRILDEERHHVTSNVNQALMQPSFQNAIRESNRDFNGVLNCAMSTFHTPAEKVATQSTIPVSEFDCELFTFNTKDRSDSGNLKECLQLSGEKEQVKESIRSSSQLDESWESSESISFAFRSAGSNKEISVSSESLQDAAKILQSSDAHKSPFKMWPSVQSAMDRNACSTDAFHQNVDRLKVATDGLPSTTITTKSCPSIIASKKRNHVVCGASNQNESSIPWKQNNNLQLRNFLQNKPFSTNVFTAVSFNMFDIDAAGNHKGDCNQYKYSESPYSLEQSPCGGTLFTKENSTVVAENLQDSCIPMLSDARSVDDIRLVSANCCNRDNDDPQDFNFYSNQHTSWTTPYHQKRRLPRVSNLAAGNTVYRTNAVKRKAHTVAEATKNDDFPSYSSASCGFKSAGTGKALKISEEDLSRASRILQDSEQVDWHALKHKFSHFTAEGILTPRSETAKILTDKKPSVVSQALSLFPLTETDLIADSISGTSNASDSFSFSSSSEHQLADFEEEQISEPIHRATENRERMHRDSVCLGTIYESICQPFQSSASSFSTIRTGCTSLSRGRFGTFASAMRKTTSVEKCMAERPLFRSIIVSLQTRQQLSSLIVLSFNDVETMRRGNFVSHAIRSLMKRWIPIVRSPTSFSERIRILDGGHMPQPSTKISKGNALMCASLPNQPLDMSFQVVSPVLEKTAFQGHGYLPFQDEQKTLPPYPDTSEKDEKKSCNHASEELSTLCSPTTEAICKQHQGNVTRHDSNVTLMSSSAHSREIEYGRGSISWIEDPMEAMTCGVSNVTLSVSSQSAQFLIINQESGKTEFSTSPPDIKNFMSRLRSLLLQCGCQAQNLKDNWIRNHARWIIWKLASIERRFVKFTGADFLSIERLVRHLQQRYNKEIRDGRRSSVRKVLNHDAAASSMMILCVARISKNVSNVCDYKNPTVVRYIVELTDGWYSLKAAPDTRLCHFIDSGKIRIGTKLLISGARLEGADAGIDPLDHDEAERAVLRISANSTRLARWTSKLGFVHPHRRHSVYDGKLLVRSLADIFDDGGTVPLIHLRVKLKHPIMYLLRHQPSDQDTQNRTVLTENEELERLEDLETKKQKIVDQYTDILQKECLEDLDEKAPEIWDTMIKDKSPQDFYQKLDADDRNAIDRWKDRRKILLRDRMQGEMKAKLEEHESLMQSSVAFVRVLVGDISCNSSNDSEAMLTIWGPTADQINLIRKGVILRAKGLEAKAARFDGKRQLTASARNQMEIIPNDDYTMLIDVKFTSIFRIHLLSKQLRCESLSDARIKQVVYVVGIVVCVKTGENNGGSWIYLTDESSLPVRITCSSNFRDVPNSFHSLIRACSSESPIPIALCNVRIHHFDRCLNCSVLEFGPDSWFSCQPHSRRYDQLKLYACEPEAQRNLMRLGVYLNAGLPYFQSNGLDVKTAIGYICGFQSETNGTNNCFIVVDCGGPVRHIWRFALENMLELVQIVDSECKLDTMVFDNASRSLTPLGSLGSCINRFLNSCRQILFTFNVRRIIEDACPESLKCKYEVISVKTANEQACCDIYSTLLQS